MFLNKCLRKAVVTVFYWPFITSAVLKSVLPGLCRPWRPVGRDYEPGAHSDSLAYTGMSGRFTGTVVTLFVKRIDVQSWLPPELAIVENDRLPDWLQERDDHPVILIFGEQVNLGKRRRILGLYQTVPVFRPYLETFVVVPFLKPKAREGPCPCFHFLRVVCSTFWPTELGIRYMGWPKIQCPMEMREQDQTLTYSIRDPRGENPWFTAQADRTDPAGLDARHERLRRVISMLSQPHVLIKGQELCCYRFDLRFEAATLKAVPASGTVYPDFLPFIHEPMDFSFPKITDVEFGAFCLETTFMNRLLERTSLNVSGLG